MSPHMTVPGALNTLSAGLILISAFAMVATRQVQGVVRFFVIQSLLLASSCFLLGFSQNSVRSLRAGYAHRHCQGRGDPVGACGARWPRDLYVRREIEQVFNIPSSLLLALLLAIAAVLLVSPLTAITPDPVIRINLPIGLAGVLIGAYSLMARREAVPQLIGILAMENGAFFAGIAIAARIASDRRTHGSVQRDLITVVVGLLTQKHQRNHRNHRSRRVARAEGGARIMALIAVSCLPLFAALLCWIPLFRRAAWVISVYLHRFRLRAGPGAWRRSDRAFAGGRAIAGWIEADGLCALMLVLVSFVLRRPLLFARGYMRHDEHSAERIWWFYCNYNLFVFALLAVPALAEPNLVWVGVELITLFRCSPGRLSRTRASALEAAWKYAVLTIMGAPIALLGFLVLVLGVADAAADVLRRLGMTLSAQRRRHAAGDSAELAFLLVFVGFGAKVGLAPMHTWLPDAHSQAPSPVCAVLVRREDHRSALRDPAVAFRGTGVAGGANGPLDDRDRVVVASAIAAFLLLQVHDYKRMFAYSTVEHMGIILTAAGLATRASDFGAVSQMLNHAITKSLCFYVAGTVLVTLETREIKSVRGLLRVSPFMGATLLLCALAIAGAPPFPIFLSEFSILSAGVRGGHGLAVGILASLIVLAFIGIMLQVNRMVFGRTELPFEKVSIPSSCRIAVIAAVLPVIVFGIYIPSPLHSLLRLAAQQLGGH